MVAFAFVSIATGIFNGGGGRVTLEWDEAVVAAARRSGRVLDVNGYLALTSVLRTATEDDSPGGRSARQITMARRPHLGLLPR